jgi:uncharacterized protein (DUF1501 family)
MDLHRRQFLKWYGGLFAAGMLSSRLSWAAAPEDDHMLIVLRVWGGADNLLCFNPWTDARPDAKDLFLDENYEFKANAGGTEIHLGKSAFCLEQHARHLAVINGVFMGTNDLGHPASQNYITTAKGSPNAPHFVAELAEFFRKQKSGQSETILFNADLKTFDLNKLTRLPLQRLKQLAVEGGAAGGPFETPLLSTDDNAVNRAGRYVRDNAHTRKLFIDKFKEVLALTGQTGDGNVASELIAAAAFASGLARFAQVDWSYLAQLDSHENYPLEHQKSQVEVWERLNLMLNVMSDVKHHASGLPLFPHHVTFAAITEFGRLPYLNPALGKDHDVFDNSVLLGGRGVKGGVRIGDHHLYVRDDKRLQSQLSGCHVDFVNGQTVKDGYYNLSDLGQAPSGETERVRLIRPENVLRTLGDIFKVDPSLMRLYGKDVPPVPRILA